MTTRSKLLVIGEGLASGVHEAGPAFGTTWIVRQLVMRNNSGATGSLTVQVLYVEPVATIFTASVLNTNIARTTDWFAVQFPVVIRINFTQTNWMVALFGAELEGVPPDPEPVVLL